MNEEYYKEMINKGSSKYRRMYPQHAAEIYQIAAEAVGISIERDYRGGAVILLVRGNIIKWLRKMTGPSCEYNDEIPGEYVWSPRQSRKRVLDLIDVITDEPSERDLLLRIADGYSINEIADQMGCTRQWVRKRLTRIAKRQRYKNEYDRLNDEVIAKYDDRELSESDDSLECGMECKDWDEEI